MSDTTMTQAKLFAAIAQLQADLPRIAKGETAKVQSDKGNYTYQYAGLDDVAAAIMPRLAQFGLGFTAKPTVTEDGFGLVYKLVHESGESDDGFYPLPDPRTTKPQTVGSMITYARRYCLCSVTGVTPGGDDDDAASAQADFQSAGAAFENASPVRPVAKVPAPRPEKPGTTDTAWLDGALAQAGGGTLAADKCRSLWRESAEKVRGGTVAREDAKRLQDLLKARIEDLGREAKAKAELDPADSWSVKVDSIGSAQEASVAADEVLDLWQGGQIDTDRRDALIGAIEARFPASAPKVGVPA